MSITLGPVPVLVALVAGAAFTAGCGRSTPPVADGPIEAPPGKERPIGTTGLPALDWGNGVDEIAALYPTAGPSGAGLLYKGDVERRPAAITFGMDGDGLHQVDIAWDATFDSMNDCGEALHQLRPLIDARLGTGAEENLAVFWENDTTNVVLSCNISDDESASLSQTYQRKVAQ